MTLVFAVFGQIMVVELNLWEKNMVFFGPCRSLDSATVTGVSLALWSVGIYEKRKAHENSI